MPAVRAIKVSHNITRSLRSMILFDEILQSNHSADVLFFVLLFINKVGGARPDSSDKTPPNLRAAFNVLVPNYAPRRLSFAQYSRAALCLWGTPSTCPGITST